MSDYYNILSIDGGGIRGLIPAVVIKEMELYAYNYAKDNAILPLVPAKWVSDELQAIQMTALFDMTAGTSTGSIIAAGLAMPKSLGDKTQGPKFFGKDMIEIYDKRGSEIFQKYSLDMSLGVLYVFLFLIFFTVVFFLAGRHKYDNPADNVALDNMYKVVKKANKIMKGAKPEDVEAEEAKEEQKEQKKITDASLKNKASMFFRTLEANNYDNVVSTTGGMFDATQDGIVAEETTAINNTQN